MPAPDVLEAALWLQSRGLYVFAVDHPGEPECVGAHAPDHPCDGSRGKHPTGRWSRDATLDAGKIRAALSRGLRNIGVAASPSGLLVVDEDRPNAFGRYAESIGATVPDTFAVTTAKGRHYYFWQPDGAPLGNSAGAMSGQGIDVRGGRGRGGYVVGPGSVHATGALYEPVDSSAPILPAPEWLVGTLRSSPSRPPTPSGTRPVRRGGRPFRVLAGLVDTVLSATPEEDRNSRLYWAGCRAYEHAEHGLFDAEAAHGALLDAARRVGLPDGEAERTLASAERMVREGQR